MTKTRTKKQIYYDSLRLPIKVEVLYSYPLTYTFKEYECEVQETTGSFKPGDRIQVTAEHLVIKTKTKGNPTTAPANLANVKEKYHVISLEAIRGQDNQGWEINAAHLTGRTIILPPNPTTRAILRALREVGQLSDYSKTRTAIRDSDMDSDGEFTILWKANQRPICQITMYTP